MISPMSIKPNPRAFEPTVNFNYDLNFSEKEIKFLLDELSEYSDGTRDCSFLREVEIILSRFNDQYKDGVSAFSPPSEEELRLFVFKTINHVINETSKETSEETSDNLDSVPSPSDVVLDSIDVILSEHVSDLFSVNIYGPSMRKRLWVEDCLEPIQAYSEALDIQKLQRFFLTEIDNRKSLLKESASKKVGCKRKPGSGEEKIEQTHLAAKKIKSGEFSSEEEKEKQSKALYEEFLSLSKDFPQWFEEKKNELRVFSEFKLSELDLNHIPKCLKNFMDQEKIKMT